MKRDLRVLAAAGVLPLALTAANAAKGGWRRTEPGRSSFIPVAPLADIRRSEG